MDAALLGSYSVYAAFVLAKTLLMAPLTSRQRFAKKVFANEEDTKRDIKAKVAFTDQDVERVRRAHLNDLENILPFVVLGFVYALSGPNPVYALWHFRAFAAARVLHTVVYVGQVPQPARGLAWAVGYGVCWSMAIQVIIKYGLKYF